MGKTKFCTGISDISDSYSAFLIDQWGVLHDGNKPYEGVIDCLKELKNRQKEVIILSNSGKRSEENKERLKKLGIGPSLYTEIVTSGEMTWQGLHDQTQGFFKNMGKKCFLMSRGGDRSIINGLDIEVVDDIMDADFLLISGTDAPHKTMVDYYEPLLKRAIRKGLKAICANPDSRALMGDSYVMGPGLIARRYQDFGGIVHYIGKPHAPIYQYCIQKLQAKSIYPGQIVMLGDTMAHDILGAASVGIDTCLMKCGIHQGAFKNAEMPKDVDHTLNVLVLQYNNVRPTYLADTMKWGNPLPDRKHKKRAK